MAQAGEDQAVTILVLGILGLVLCTPLGIAAMVMGQKIRKQAALTGQAVDGRVTAGYIMGVIATVFVVLTLFAFLVAGLIALGASTTAP
jgi:hypothetical protein